LKDWKCPLCGNSEPRNLEDALPNWIRNYAERQPGGPYIGTAYGRPYSGKRPPAFRVPVCVSCNNWMGSTFEESARPILIPLFQGQPQIIEPEDQRLIARWMAKSALMQELFDGVKGRVPIEVYRTFRQTGEPPADCRVFIGRYADNGRLPVAPSSSANMPTKLPMDQQSPGRLRWEAITPSPILGFFVGQFLLPLTANRFVSVAAQRGLVIPIWPLPGYAVHWPPEQSFTAQNAFLRDIWKPILVLR
jgi:hypothetical protein